MDAEIVELDDAGHQAVNRRGNGDGDDRQDHDLLGETGAGHRAQRNGDDFRREDEVGSHGALDLVLLERQPLFLRLQFRGGADVFLACLGATVQKLVGQLFRAFVTEKRAAQHQQRGDQPGSDHADQKRRRHQNQLVAQRPFRHSPHDWQLATGANAGDLLGIERQIVTQHARRLLGSHLGHEGNVVEQRGDIVE